MQAIGHIRTLATCLAFACLLVTVTVASPPSFAQDSVIAPDADFAVNIGRLTALLEESEKLVDSQPEQALAKSLTALGQAGPRTPPAITARLLAANSMALSRMGSNRQALEKAKQAFTYLAALDDTASSLAKGKVLTAHARASHNLGDLVTALELFYKAWSVYRDLGDDLGMADMSVQRAIIYEEIGQLDRAITTYNDALTHAENANDDFLKIRIINNLAYTFLRHGEPEKALAMLQDIRPLALKLQNPLALAFVEDNIGEALFELGRTVEARIYLLKSFSRAETLGIPSLVSGIHLYLGYVEEAEGNLDLAMAHAQEGLADARAISEPARIRDLLALKARLYYALGNYQDAYRDLQQSYHYRNEINNREVSHLAEVLGAQFSLDRKEQEISLLQRDQEISALRLEREKTMRQGALYGSFVLLALIVGLVMLLRSRTLATRHAEAKSRELLDMQDELERVSQAKSSILAMTSHEVKTPLNGIMGMAQILLRSNLAPEQRQQLQTLYSSADMLMTLLNDILDLSRIEAGHVEICPDIFELGDMLDSLHLLWKTRTDAKGLTLAFHRDSSLPDTLIADAGRIRQILSNLISNAIKFTDEGAISVSVKSTAMEGAREFVLFTVDDDGIGIDTDHTDDLFMPFVQLDSGRANPAHAGSGLGLSICRELVTLMGGEIGYEALPRKGTRFWFTIPLERALAKSGTPSDDIRETHEYVQDTGAPGRILIAEDNEMNKMVLTEMLRPHPWELQFADNGMEAVELVKTGMFDLVLMDLHMPVMNGTEAVSAIRALDGHVAQTPIIALSAYPLSSLQHKDLCREMDGYLEKPIDRAALLVTIRRHIGSEPDEGREATAKVAQI